MNIQMSKLFYNVLVNSLSTPQVNYLGELLDKSFNLARVSGFSPSIPIPRQNAAETLMFYFKEEDDIVRLFSILLAHEGEYFYNRDLNLWGKDEFIKMLRLNKWIYDSDLKQFFIDPFYEHEINLLKKIRIIDLRQEIDIDDMIEKITAASKKMSIQDIDWRITLRLYDLESRTGELIRKIINLLLARQNLQMFTPELFFCLKELAINASKANYKILFQKHVTSKQGIDPQKQYTKFLDMFKSEIEENGNTNLLALAKQEDRHYNIIFQSSLNSIEIWVTNNQNISIIEKEQILKKIAPDRLYGDSFVADEDEKTEGAGLGLNLILNVLKKYTGNRHPLKVIFYPDFIKIGFELKRSEMLQKIPSPA